MRSQTAIRPATDVDSGQVASLIAACWVVYPGCVLDIGGEEPVLRAIASGFAAKGGRFWAACENGWVIGCVGLTPAGADATAHLQKMYVHPRRRRLGLARRLADLAEQTARDWGCTRMELWSDTRFREAHSFYKAMGYEQTGRVRDLHDRSQSSEFAFVKDLTD